MHYSSIYMYYSHGCWFVQTCYLVEKSLVLLMVKVAFNCHQLSVVPIIVQVS